MLTCKDMPLKSWAKIYMFGRGKRGMPLGGLLSDGNIKLPKTTAVFNMSSATDCPSKRLGLCKACAQGVKCYALKAEFSYHPFSLPYRRKQEHFWKNISAKEFVSQFIFINSLKNNPYSLIRFNESGDFHNQSEVDKTEEIALHLRRFGIRCYCYTSRSDLDFSKCRHLIVTGSNFKKVGISNVFRIVNDVKKERKKGESVCKMNCRICRLCTMRNMRIVVKKH